MSEPMTRSSRRPSGAQLGVGVAVLLAAAALTVAFVQSPAPATAAAPHCGGSTPQLTVQGSGLASGSPDALDLQAQVDVTASSAQSALAQDNSVTAAVVAAVEANGVVAKDVQTTDLTINPDYTTSNGRSVIDGYDVSNSVDITVRKLAGAGAVIDAASAAGGNSLDIFSVSFERADPRTLEDQARHDAVRQAVVHAGAMAAAAGQRLGVVCSLTDNSGIEAQPLANGRAYAEATAGPASVPLEGGTEQASAQVTLVYQLLPLR
jgi:uncharacterized protein